MRTRSGLLGFAFVLGAAVTAAAQVPPPPPGAGGQKKKQTASGGTVVPTPPGQPGVQPVPPGVKPGTPTPGAKPGQPAKPMTPEEKAKAEAEAKKKAEEAKKKAEEAKKKAEEAKKKALEQRYKMMRFQRLLKLRFDRRPSAVLKAWAAPQGEAAEARDAARKAVMERRSQRIEERRRAALTPEQRAREDKERKEAEEAAKKKAEAIKKAGGPKPNPQKEMMKRLTAELAQVNRWVTLGEWDSLQTYIGDLPPAQGTKFYLHLLRTLDLDHNRQSVAPKPGTLRESNLISPDDFKGLADCSPVDLEPQALVYLASLLKRCLAQGHELSSVAKQWDAGTRRLGGKDWYARASVGALLSNAGYLDEAKTFLPTPAAALERDEFGLLLLLVNYHEQLYARDQKSAALEAAWDVNQQLLGAKGTDATLLQAGLTNAVRLLPKVKEKLGNAWIRRSFTKDVVRGREVMAAIGSTVAANRARAAKDTDTRKQGLQLQQTLMEALFENAPEQADQWGEICTLMAKNWLQEASYTNAEAATTSGRRQFRRDYYGNVYYYNWNTSRNNRKPDPVPAGEMLRLVPADTWIKHIDQSLYPHVLAVRAKLHLKVQEDDEAYPFIEELASLRPREAHDLAEQYLRMWVDNHDFNRNSNRTSYYSYMWGFEQRANSIPLTRSKQERNMTRLSEILNKLRALPIKPIDEELIAMSFIRLHSKAEVYRLENMEKVFGKVENLSAKTLSRLVQTMRSNLASIWKDPRVQKKNETKRTDLEIQAEIQRGYGVALTLAEHGLQKYPDDWQLALARATVMYDGNHFRNKEQTRSSEFTAGRKAAYAKFAEAAELYGKALPDIKPDDRKTDVYEHWWYAALGASDLPRVRHDHIPDLTQMPKIKAALAAVPGEAGKQLQAKFAAHIFARMSSVNPGVKMTYLKTAFAIVGNHEDAQEAREIYDYYKDLVTEIDLEARIDGSDRVGHGRPFGLFVNILHTKEIERESGGFAKYLQNQNAGRGYYYNYGRPNEDYRQKFEDAAREILKEHFEVISVTFHEPKIKSRGTPRVGWRVTPYAYILMKPRGPEVDKIPSLKMDFDFLDTSGYVVLPVTSAPLPIDCTPAKGDGRPIRDVEITQTLDERRAGEGLLVLEVQAKGHGLMPDLDQLIDLQLADFEVTKTEDNGVAASQLDAESQDNLIISQREWTLHLKGREGLTSLPKKFTFGGSKVDGAELLFQRYQDADLEKVAQTVSLEYEYGSTSYGWLWVTLFLLMAAGVGGFFLFREEAQTQQQVIRWTLPQTITPFTVLELLHRIHDESPLTAGQKDELAAEIRKIEAHYFAGADQGAELDLAGTARNWAARAPVAAGAGSNGTNGTNGSRRPT